MLLDASPRPATSITTGSAQRVRADLPHQHAWCACRRSAGSALRGARRDSLSSTAPARAAPAAGSASQSAPLRDIGPAARPGDPPGDRLDVAVDPVHPRHALGEPAERHMPVAFAQMLEQLPDEARVRLDPQLAKSGTPHAAHSRATASSPCDRSRTHGSLGEPLEHRQVDRLGRGAQLASPWGLRSRSWRSARRHRSMSGSPSRQ